jgi:7,8-dihydropterin-6-yl-methyl-4-(beta-D-ribofuranosyl)aminobenzene 5'-phosphate synthase
LEKAADKIMIIKTLSENTSISEDFASEHGLSLYIETKKHKVLFDVGASDLFLQNAKTFGINIADIDFLVISHGHYDHGGGLKTFFEENEKAEVIIHQLAFEKYYSTRSNNKIAYIGLDENLKQNRQIVFTSDYHDIGNGIYVFSNILQSEPLPKSNNTLFKEYKDQIIPDSFEHEQNLVIEEDGKTLLITGCAHNGIVNIVKRFYTLKGRMPDYIIGGFHLSSRSGGDESSEMTDKIAEYLKDTKAKYYTCHCTGIEPYKRMKSVMSDRIDYLAAGSELTI